MSQKKKKRGFQNKFFVTFHNVGEEISEAGLRNEDITVVCVTS